MYSDQQKPPPQGNDLSNKEHKKIKDKVVDKEYLRYFQHYVPGYNPTEIELPDHSIDTYDIRKAVLELKKALDEEHIDTEKSISILMNFKFFLENTQYVPYDIFLKSFKNSMDSLFSSLKKENYGIVINKVDPARSNEWMINVFLSFLGNRREPSFIMPMENYVTLSPEFKDIKNIVMIDDVSYSGDQIVGYVMEFSQNKLDVQLHILLSYVTSVAQQKIREKAKEVKIYGTPLTTFAEKIYEKRKRIDDFIFCNYPLYKTNAVFQHKLADANSSYPEIYQGKFCFIDNNKKYNIEFSIPLIQNCDRSLPQCYKPFYSEQIPEKLAKL